MIDSMSVIQQAVSKEWASVFIAGATAPVRARWIEKIMAMIPADGGEPCILLDGTGLITLQAESPWSQRPGDVRETIKTCLRMDPRYGGHP